MWFIGLVIGAIIGSIGDGRGVVVGALIGAAIGWAVAEKMKAGGEDRLARLEPSLRSLQERVSQLETSGRRQERSPVAPIPEIRDGEATAPVIEARQETLSLDTDAGPVSSPEVPGFSQPTEQRPVDKLEAIVEPGAARPGTVWPQRPSAPPALWNFFFGGNTLVRVGVIVLFFGVAFLLKYASERIEIPIEARLIGVALGAIVMLAIGWEMGAAPPRDGLGL